MNELLLFYKELLESLGCRIGQDGVVYQEGPDANPIKVTVGGVERTLYLPTPEVLGSSLEWDKVVMFHPACETITGGQSEILHFLIQLIRLKAWGVIMTGAVAIGSLAAAPDAKHPIKVTMLTAKLGEVTSTFSKYLQDVITKNTDISGPHQLFKIRMRQGETIDSVKYVRSCKIVRTMAAEPDPLYGIKTSKANAAALRALFDEILLPDDFQSVTQEINSPYLSVLLTTWHSLATHLNGIFAILGKYRGGMELIHTDWYARRAVLANWQTHLPQVFPGNVGISKKAAETPAPEAVADTGYLKRSLGKVAGSPAAGAPVTEPTTPIAAQAPTPTPAPVATRGIELGSPDKPSTMDYNPHSQRQPTPIGGSNNTMSTADRIRQISSGNLGGGIASTTGLPGGLGLGGISQNSMSRGLGISGMSSLSNGLPPLTR